MLKVISNNKQILALFSIISIYILLSIFATSCANSSIAPTGGAKDSIPPVVTNMAPQQKSTNFNGKEVVLTFNEYVQLKDQNKNFVISPPLPEKKPVLKIKGKSVVVSFPSLDENTTYYLDFGASVVDVNEGNPAGYLNFIFSTGSELDTLMYAGRVVDAYTLEPVEGANVFLYKDDSDSVIYKTNPSALSITNKEGVYIIKGLKDIKYKLVAITDKNSNMRYETGVEQIAFADSPIQPIVLSENDSIALEALPVSNAFMENIRRQGLTENKRPEERLITLAFNSIYPVIQSFVIDGINPSQIITETSRYNDSISYWLVPRTVKDSLSATLIYLKSDSVNNLVPDTVKFKWNYSKPKPKNKKNTEEEEEDIIPIEPSITAANTKIIEDGVTLNFKTPLLRVDPSKISLSVFDDAGKEKIPVKDISFTQDTANGIRRYKLSAKWKVASKYELVILPEAFVDIYSITNDTISKTFETADPEKFGKLNMLFENPDKQYILQLMTGKNIVQEKIISPKNNKTVFEYLNAGKYKIKVIEDLNTNGEWDTGNYLEKKQPERTVFLIFSNNDEIIDIKSNWEHDQTIDATNLFK